MQRKASDTIASSEPTLKLLTPNLYWLAPLAGLVAIYGPSFWDVSHTIWQGDDQMHGPIILVVTLYLLWSLRHEVMDAPIAPKPILGWTFFGIGVLFFVLGRSQDIIILELGSLLFILPALLLLLRGVAALKACWFPIFFLAFMIPLPGPVVDALTLPMKTFVSWATEHILHALDYPIARTGVILHLGQYKLLVADACAGLHTLFSLEAMGLLYLHLTKNESWGRNVTLAILIIPISLTANTIRVLTLSLVTYHFGDEAGQGFLHDFAGIVLFVSALLLIIVVDTLIHKFIQLRQRLKLA